MGEAKKRFRLTAFQNKQLVPWITNLAIGLYIAIGSHAVLEGSITLGGFLATMQIYRDLGERFEWFYSKIIQEFLAAMVPLLCVMQLFNYPTDVPDRMKR